MAIPMVQESFQKGNCHQSSGRVHETERFRPLVLDNVETLVIDPPRHHRGKIVKPLEGKAKHVRYVLLQGGRKRNLVFFLRTIGCLRIELRKFFFQEVSDFFLNL